MTTREEVHTSFCLPWDYKVKHTVSKKEATNCWYCNYPLSEAGYTSFTDTKAPEEVLVFFRKSMRLPSECFPIPFVKRYKNEIEVSGLTCSIGCCMRYVFENNDSREAQNYVVSLAMERGLSVEKIRMHSNKLVLRAFGGTQSYQEFRWTDSIGNSSTQPKRVEVSDSLFVLTPVHYQDIELEEEKIDNPAEEVKHQSSRFDKFILDAKNKNPSLFLEQPTKLKTKPKKTKKKSTKKVHGWMF